MKDMINNQNFINKSTSLIKFTLTLFFMCFLILKVPDQIGVVTNIAAAFVLGSSKIPTKIGL